MKEEFDIQEYRNPKASPGLGILAFVGAGVLFAVTIVLGIVMYGADSEASNRARGKVIFFPLMGSIYLCWVGWQKTLGVSKIVIDGEGLCSYTRLSKTFVAWDQIDTVSMEDQKQFIGGELSALTLRNDQGKVLMKIAQSIGNFTHLSYEVKRRVVGLQEEMSGGETSDRSDEEKMAALMRKKPVKAKKTFMPKFSGMVFLVLGGLFTVFSGYVLYIQVGLSNGGTVTEATVTSSRYRNQTVAVEYRYRVPGDFIVDRCDVSHEEWKKVKEGEPFKVRYSTSDPRYSCYYKGKTYGSFMVTGIFFFVGLVMLAIAYRLFKGKKGKEEKVGKKDGDFDPKGPLFE